MPAGYNPDVANPVGAISDAGSQKKSLMKKGKGLLAKAKNKIGGKMKGVDMNAMKDKAVAVGKDKLKEEAKAGIKGVGGDLLKGELASKIDIDKMVDKAADKIVDAAVDAAVDAGKDALKEGLGDLGDKAVD